MSNFNVITGKNGSGKSSLLKFIKDKLEFLHQNSEKISLAEFPLKSEHFIEKDNENVNEKVIPLILKVNETVETIGDETFFRECIENDTEYTLNKTNSSFEYYNFCFDKGEHFKLA